MKEFYFLTLRYIFEANITFFPSICDCCCFDSNTRTNMAQDLYGDGMAQASAGVDPTSQS